MTKIIFFDVETTGLDPVKCGMHQLAGTIVMNDEVVGRFDYKINPFKGCEVSKEALAVSNTQALDFLKYNQEWQVIHMFTQLLDKFHGLHEVDKKDKFYLAGWRAPEFDVKFLGFFFKRNITSDLFKYYFWSNPIDVKTLATQYLIEQRPRMHHFHLVDVAKFLGVEVDETKLHSAEYDAYLCRRVYYRLPYPFLNRTSKKLIKKVQQ